MLEMLNSIPGVLINGEHNGQLWALLSALNHATRGQHGVESVEFASVFGNYSNLVRRCSTWAAARLSLHDDRFAGWGALLTDCSTSGSQIFFVLTCDQY